MTGLKKSRFSAEQIIAFLWKAETSTPIRGLRRNGGFSVTTFYKWCSKGSGMPASETQLFCEPESEYAKFKLLLAEAHVDTQAINIILAVKR